MSPTVSALHATIKEALTDAGLHVQFGPAINLPTEGGMVSQAVVLWPAPGAHQYQRASGTRSGRVDRVTMTCVGATALDAVAVAEAVELAIGGMRLSDKGGTLRQSVATSPEVEPNANPRRVSCALEYTTVTKG